VNDNLTPHTAPAVETEAPLSPSDTSLSISEDSNSPSQMTVKDLTKTLRITVREDGSVDWDEALASGTTQQQLHACIHKQ